MLGVQWKASSLLVVVTCAILCGCTLPRPQGPGTLASPPGGQCNVRVLNESVQNLHVTYTIRSNAGTETRDGDLGVLAPGASGLVSAFCGENVVARGTANGRTTRGSARARDGGSEIVLRMGAF